MTNETAIVRTEDSVIQRPGLCPPATSPDDEIPSSACGRRGYAGRARALLHEESGVSATEFAIIAPLFLIILAGVTDIGFSLYSKIRMESMVSAVANYAMTAQYPLSEADAEEFLQDLNTLAHTARQGNALPSVDTVKINLNNAFSSTWTNGAISFQGDEADLLECYCPTRTGGSIAWGGVQACNSLCTDGSSAAKHIWVEITNSSPLSVFREFGFSASQLSSSALIRMK